MLGKGRAMIRPRSLLPTAVAAAALALPAAAGHAAAAAPGPSRALASAYAARTYVDDPGLGRRTFALIGHSAVARAADGTTLTAFGMVLADSGDGTGQAVLLFDGTRFLGWGSAYEALHLNVAASGSAVRVRYGVYRGNDPFCCPSSTKTVHYRYRGGKIVADGAPPLIYGKHGPRLHLASSPTSR
jgi:hypothetical protein